MRSDAEQNRERVLAAAEEVFTEQGAGGSTEEIARRAGVGVGTVFRHFPTKDALVEATIVRHFDTLTARAETSADASDPGRAFRALVRTMIDDGATKLALLSVAGGSAAGIPPSAAQASQRLRAAVEVVLRRAQGAGAIRRGVTIDEVYLLVRGLAQASAAAPVPPRTLRRAADVVLAGLAT